MDNETTQVDIDPADLQQPQSDTIDNKDGTTTLILEDEEPPSSNEWFGNLALTLPESTLDELAQKYLDLIDQDIEARKERDKQQADGIKKSGIGEPAPGGADFEGASRCTHPVLAEAYIDFAASAIKELFPPNGPVKIKIEGKPNKEKMDRAKRKADFMNWQLIREIPSYRPELERLLTQLPVGGSQYMKLYWNETQSRPDVEFIPIDDIVLPYEARNFFDLQRKFHRMSMSDFTYSQRVRSEQYRDYNLPNAYGLSLEPTASAKATDRIEGKKADYSSESGERIVYEGCVYDEIGDNKSPEDMAVPYLITIDEESRKVLSLYRNWNEEDKKYREIEYLVDFTFIPWRGVFGLSLLQCVGGLPDALTGSLRALLDSALISNMQGGLKLKGTPGGASLSISPTQVTEVDAMGQDDIRKVYMPIPFNQPSPMLFQLLGFLTAAAKEVVGTAEEKIADAGANMPVGTTLALIEQGAKVFSAIHARLQDSQRRCLEILHRLNKDHLPENEKFVFGTDPDDYVTKADFEGAMDVRPVSDPNIFSETQRFAQIQFVMQSIIQAAQVMPQVVQLFDLRALYARAFEMAKIPDYEEFLPETPKAQPMNPVDENVAMVMGKPVKAYAGQNHEAHIQVLLDFAKNPMLGQSPIISSKFVTAALNHLMDHVLVWYEEMMKAAAAQEVNKKPDDMEWDNTPESSVLLAKAAPVVDKASELAFGQIPQLVQMALKQLQASMPQPPQDPMIGIAQGQLSLAQQKATSDAHMKMMVTQEKAQEAARDYQLELQKAGIGAHVEMQKAELQSQTDLAKTIHDNTSAQHIAAMKIAAGGATKLEDGASLNGNG